MTLNRPACPSPRIMTVKLPARAASVSDKAPSARQYHRQTSQLQRAAVDTHQRLATTFEKLAPRRMLCALLLCRLSVVNDQCTQCSHWEGEAPAEPKAVVSSQWSVVSGQWSVVSQNVARAFLPGRPLAHTKPPCSARSPVAQLFRGPIITKQMATRHRHRAGARWS